MNVRTLCLLLLSIAGFNALAASQTETEPTTATEKHQELLKIQGKLESLNNKLKPESETNAEEAPEENQGNGNKEQSEKAEKSETKEEKNRNEQELTTIKKALQEINSELTQQKNEQTKKGEKSEPTEIQRAAKLQVENLLQNVTAYLPELKKEADAEVVRNSLESSSLWTILPRAAWAKSKVKTVLATAAALVLGWHYRRELLQACKQGARRIGTDITIPATLALAYLKNLTGKAIHTTGKQLLNFGRKLTDTPTQQSSLFLRADAASNPATLMQTA